MESIRLIVPSSTSNLGPGFDTLGLALDWPLQVEAKPAGRHKVEIEGVDREWREPMSALVAHAVEQFEAAASVKCPMSLKLSGALPLARGLGSSAVYRTAAVSAANQVAGSPLGPDRLLAVVARLEKHTDNATPCLLGGLTASGWLGDTVRVLRAPVPESFRFATLIPEQRLATAEARKALPKKIPREDAVHNIQRVAWLFNALAAGDGPALRGLFEDKLHQPYREFLVPYLPRVIAAATEAGAFGGFLSGAGSTIIAVADEACAQPAADAMLAALTAAGVKGEARVLKADNLGTRAMGD